MRAWAGGSVALLAPLMGARQTACSKFAERNKDLLTVALPFYNIVSHIVE